MASFKTLKLQLHDSPGVYHHIYYKQHSSKQDSELLPKKKTLFVLNPPLDTVNGLTAVFEEAGSVEAVRATVTEVQQKDHKPVKAAYVVFKKTSSATKALAFDDAKERVLPEPDAKEFGLKRWASAYDAQRPEVAVMQKAIDKDMRKFDSEQAKAKALELAMDGKEDEEGWTYVAKGGKLVAEDEETELEVAGVKPRNKKDRELKNFYRFQMKEERKEQIALLRKKFDLDKQRVTQMRGDRKFRPY